MKGVVFNLFEQVVSAEHGDDTWDDVLDRAGVVGAYASVGQYADGELMALIAAASEELDRPPHDVVRWFGRSAMPILHDLHPHFFDHDDLRPFLLSINHVIHAEVRKLHPDADLPAFDFEDVDDDLVLVYRSHRRLCHLAEGFIAGAADVFGTEVSVSQETCMLTGDPACRIVCRFGS